MKKSIILILSLTLILGLLVSGCASDNESEEAVPYQSAAPDEEIIPDKNTDAELLILVNGENKLPDDYVPELTTEGATVNVLIFDDFSEMRKAAIEEEIYLMVGSVFRTADEQEKLFNELGPSLAQRPGYSEHQTGLAIDFSYGGLSEEERTAMWNWLRDNAHKYGFILRYPEGKSDITGIDYEPWHYRYVGKEHAEKIYEQGIVLEEYLALY